MRFLTPGSSGSLAGLLATLPMSLVFMLFHPRRPHRDTPPARVARGIVERAGLGRCIGEKHHAGFAMASHLSFGATMGGLFGACRGGAATGERGRSLSMDLATGVAFGLTVCGLSYAGWLPLLGLVPPPRRQSSRRNQSLILAHVVYGLALGGLYHLFNPPAAPRTPSAVRRFVPHWELDELR